MTNIKVQPPNIIKVRVGDQTSTKVVSSSLSSNTNSVGGVQFNLSGIQDNYVLQYDSTTQSIIAVDPDQVLQDSVPGGIPGDFINVLDTDLNRVDNIDFDGGNF